jgi:hypothetical protein
MTTDVSLVPTIYELDLRNAAAEAVIKAVAARHAAIDAATGMLGCLIPVPGVAAATVVGQLAYQTRFVYPDLVRRLAVVYGTAPDSFTRKVTTQATVLETAVDGLVAAAGTELFGHLAGQLLNGFGTAFLQEIAWDLVREGGVGAALSSIPIVGALFAGTVDAAMAATMTWRVGALVSAYFQNGGYITSRRHTYGLVKRTGMGLSAKLDRPGSLTRLRTDIPEIRAKHRDFARMHYRALADTMDPAQIRELLVTRHGIPADVVDAVQHEF